MSTVKESVDVAVPVHTAYDQWTHFESFPEFMGGIEEVVQTDDKHSHWRTKIAGVKREFDTVVIDQQPDERVAWKSTDGTTHAGIVSFSPLSDKKSRVTVQIEWWPEGLTEKAGETVGVDDRQVKADLKRFKSFIESRGKESGAWRGKIERGSHN